MRAIVRLPLFLLLSFGCARAADQPETVTVGAVLNRIFDVSLHDNHFSVDLYVWFVWRDDKLNPHQTFQFMNGKLDERQEVTPRKKVNGLNYAAVRLVGTVSKYWDVAPFPLDDQTLNITIEDRQNDARKVRYAVDKENTQINPRLRFPGWEIDRARSAAEVRDVESGTNYGDPEMPKGSAWRYPQFRYRIEIVRPGFRYYWKLFAGLFVATLIAFLAFFIKVTNLDPRFGLGVGAIFAAVASQYVTSSAEPDSQVLSLADKVHITAFLFIFVSLLESTWSLYVFESGQEGRSRRMDRVAFLILFPAYVLANWLVVYFR
ncbi:MAG: hypothetical protein U0Q16_34075 [Bryobacteraceae bacterium]